MSDEVPPTAGQVPAKPSGSPVPARPEASPIGSLPSGLLRDYLEYFEGSGEPNRIDSTIIRTQSVVGRDLLVALASGGRMRWPELRHLLVGVGSPRGKAHALGVVGSMDAKTLLRLARVVSRQSLSPDDRPLALRLFQLVRSVHGHRILKGQHHRLISDLAFQTRDWELARETVANFVLTDLDRRMLDADLHNPFIGTPYADAARWLSLLNHDLVARGISSIDLLPDDGHSSPFDRLTGTTSVRVDEGPTVTVVVTSWCPGAGILTAIRSVLDQTWRNLEILVIDDSSPAEYQPVLDRVAALDPRIRVLRQPENGGTYLARNRGLLEATGKYFTVHDSDDWAHPERIERQVRALMEAPDLVSTGSMAFRCDERMVFNMVDVSSVRENASSLMFDLARVRDRIGFYDASRKGADTEYGRRMQLAFGASSHRILPETLAMIRLSAGSLSREEFKPGWRHPARTAYRRNYETWQHRVVEAGGDLYLPHPQLVDSISKPTRFMVDQHGEEVRRRQAYDYVFAADFRASAAPAAGIVEEAVACAKAGRRVAMLHLESYRHATRKEVEPLDDSLERALQRGDLDEILYTDIAHVRQLVIRDPVVLQFPQARPSGLRVASAVIVADHGSTGPDGRVHYEPLDAALGCFQMFNADPRWVATSDVARSVLAGELSERAVSRSLWPRANVASHRQVPRSGDATPVPVLCRVLSGETGSVPKGRKARARALCAGAPVRVRFLDSASAPQASRILGQPLASNWSVMSSAEISADLFFAQAGYYVHHHSGRVHGDDARWITDAIAAGCIAILQPDWEPLFGPAAIYCPGIDVASTVARLHADPDRRQAQRQAAAEWLAARHGPQAFEAAVSDFMRLC